MNTEHDEPGETAMTMTRAEAEALIASGDARPLRDYAIHYDGTWWLGDQHTYARITDEALNATLDDRARRLALADQAVEAAGRHDEPTSTPAAGHPGSGKAGTGETACDAPVRDEPASADQPSSPPGTSASGEQPPSGDETS